MSSSFGYLFLSLALTAVSGYEIYEIKQERVEIEEAILELHEREVGLHEYARLLELEIQDLKAARF